MNIIKTEIIDPNCDVFWNEMSAGVTDTSAAHVLVIVNDYEPSSNEEVQLQKMLDACKLTSGQYNIIRLKEGQMAAWHKLRGMLDPKIVFLIGVSPASLGISALFNLNFPNNFDGRLWLPTLSINELEKNAAMKLQLWNNGMKPVFVDKKPLPGLPE